MEPPSIFATMGLILSRRTTKSPTLERMAAAQHGASIFFSLIIRAFLQPETALRSSTIMSTITAGMESKSMKVGIIYYRRTPYIITASSILAAAIFMSITIAGMVGRQYL